MAKKNVNQVNGVNDSLKNKAEDEVLEISSTGYGLETVRKPDEQDEKNE